MIWAIHGFTGGSSSWSQIQEIPPSQCLTVLGHGPSSVAKGDESFADEVSRLAASLPASCDHLVGYSLGARLALAIALQDPQRIGKLSLIGVHPGLATKAERDARIALDSQWSEMLRRNGVQAFVDAWQALPLWASQQTLPSAMVTKQRELRLSHDAEQLACALDSLGTGQMKPMWHDLSRLHMPVQLIAGELDAKYLALANTMRSHLPKGEIKVIADAGHNPLLEAPEAIRGLLCPPQHARVAQ